MLRRQPSQKPGCKMQANISPRRCVNVRRHTEADSAASVVGKQVWWQRRALPYLSERPRAAEGTGAPLPPTDTLGATATWWCLRRAVTSSCDLSVPVLGVGPQEVHRHVHTKAAHRQERRPKHTRARHSAAPRRDGPRKPRRRQSSQTRAARPP